MPSLKEIFDRYGTDKARAYYPGAYECLFQRHRREVSDVLEIGIGTMIEGAHSTMRGWASPGYEPGGSLRAWRDYFENATIYGLDVQPDTQIAGEERIVTRLCDSRDGASVQALMTELARQFDIIIDDGSHYVADQISTMVNFFAHVRPGGFYIVEDVVGDNYRHIVEAMPPVCGNAPQFVLGPKNNMLVILAGHIAG